MQQKSECAAGGARHRRLVLVLAPVLALAAVGCGGAVDPAPAAGAGALPAVEALPAQSGTLPLFDEVSGVVRARNQVAIHPEISGSVVAVLVRNGDQVAPGQPLVRLDDGPQREQLRQAEAGLLMAEATAAEVRAREAEVRAQVLRTRALADSGLVSELDLETREAQLAAAEAQSAQAEARVAQARAAVAERESALDKTVVRAPATGRVGQRAVEVGMVVSPASTLFLLGDFDDLLVEVPLTQAMLRDVHEGTPVEVGARDRDEAPVRASVSRISPFLEQGSFSTVAEVDLEPGGGLRPGMFVSVRVLRGESLPATLVPTSAVWEDPRSGAELVFVVEEDDGLAESSGEAGAVPERARRVGVRPVRVLADGQGRSGVEGVEEGEWVVSVGQHLLHEQMQAAAASSTTARVRPTSWRRVLELQGLQREDLLEGFLAKQRRLAGVLGAELPASSEAVDEALAAVGGDAPPAPGPTAPERPLGGG
ncbi:MAG TPA: efflux RND transporter periplasmic adaptor subunit [Thermoanaerobaculia bacterium]|nr:efflux RND transporter periplasmic adaptor subunit [Thermoanaerobaculia bacterium]